MAMSQAEYQQKIAQYVQALRSGMSSQDAFARIFPQGLQLETEQQEAEKVAKKQGSRGLAALGGTALGALGVDAIASNIAGEPSKIGTAISGLQKLFGAGSGAQVLSQAAPVATQAAPVAAATPGAASGVAAAAPALGPIAAAIAAVIASGINFRRVSKQTETKKGWDAFKYAARNPINWAIPSGFAGALFGKKKTEGHARRDDMRRQLEKLGLTTEQDKFTFSDGTSFDISENEGHGQYKIAAADDPRVQQVMHKAYGLAGVLGGHDKHYQQHLGGFLTNAALQGSMDVGTAEKRLGEMYAKLGGQAGEGASQLKNLYDEKKIDLPTYERWLDGWNMLSGSPRVAPTAQAAPAPAPTPTPVYNKPLNMPTQPIAPIVDRALGGGAVQTLSGVAQPTTPITPEVDSNSPLAQALMQNMKRRAGVSTGRQWAIM